ncbi:MAG: SDR family NAD(P)-dependent oxidoreductase [Asgard group archaeon]|nr:SDR family NAD(P)-dependent oxidoreductase [Asgard group archaeon]
MYFSIKNLYWQLNGYSKIRTHILEIVNLNKIVVITGASSGIGLSHAIYLTYLGYTVFGASRFEVPNKDDLKKLYLQDHTKYSFTNKEKTKVKARKVLLPKKLLKTLDELLDKITFFKMDITSDESVNESVTQMELKAKEINGKGIDVILNNAGISFFKSAEDLSIEDWQKTFDTNVFGLIRVIKAILPFMRARREGQIINTSSLGAYAAIPYQTHYSASKMAVKLLTEGLGVELREFGIKVSTLLPSDINTSFNVNMLKISNSIEHTFDSYDLTSLLDNIPTDKESPYYNSVKIVWKVIVKNLIVAPPPIIISKKVAKIIRSKNPKINYKSGSLSQIFLTYLIQRIVSDKFTYTLLPKYFGL